MKADILVFAAHPDDAELGVAGTILKHKAQGKTVVIVDLTEGELGTRGSATLRFKEAAKASEVLGIDARENLGMADGFFEINTANKLLVVEMVRKYQPEIVLCNAKSDRHPDHGRGGQLVSEGCFLAGLRKIETFHNNEAQKAHRPKAIYHYIQDYYTHPDLIVDITPYWDGKMDAIKAFSSQFYDPNSKEPVSPIATKEFFDFIEGRALQFGRLVNGVYGEGFTVERPVGVDDLTELA